MNFKRIVFSLTVLITSTAFAALPEKFVYLRDVAPTIQQEIRYVGHHNIVGYPLKGYEAGECILTSQAADALSKVQTELKPLKLSLKVYDCYRPQMAVGDFVVWSKDPKKQEMKAEFYPNVNKADLFKLGYVAEKSGHSRGSTVDITIVPIPTPKQASYHPGDKLVACFAPYQKRYRDNSIDMGTGFDCMDPASNPLNRNMSTIVYEHRMLLRSVMMKNGFAPIEQEWWHFTLKNEPYPKTFFNFPVVKKS